MDLLPTSRRELLAGLTIGAAGVSVASPPTSVKAIAFDAFVLFDTGTITRRAAEFVGVEANALVAAASAKLFAYTWLYTSASRYIGFESLARDAFKFAAAQNRSSLSDAELDYLASGYAALEIWPDVALALDELRRRGVRLSLLSNLSGRALDLSLSKNGIAHQFDHVLSTDRVRKFKPAPESYAMAISTFRLPREAIGFAASASWDAAGATWFGYRSAWVNRMHAPVEVAHAMPDVISSGIEGVLALVA